MFNVKRKRDGQDGGSIDNAPTENKAQKTDTDSTVFAGIIKVVNYLNPFKSTPIVDAGEKPPSLYTAFFGNHDAIDRETIIKYISEEGYAEFSELNLNHPILVTLLRHDAFDIAERLVENGISPNCQYRGQTQLHMACRYDTLAVVKQLLALGANPYLKDDDENAPIHIAVLKGHADKVQVLLQNNSPFDLKNGNGETPLSIALEKNKLCLEIAISLLDHGANLQPLLDKHGMVQLLIKAINQGDCELIRAFHRYGLSFAYNDTTLLHDIIEQRGRITLPTIEPIIQTIVKCGVNVESRNKDEMTPLFLAVHQGDMEVVEVLLKLGANPFHLMSSQKNIMSFAKPNGVHTAFSRELKKRIQFSPEQLKIIEDQFYDMFNLCVTKANELEKKLIILIGETHNEYRCYQIEKAALEAAARIGKISHFFVESDKIPDRKNARSCGYMPLIYSLKHLPLTHVAVDQYRDKGLLSDLSLLGMSARDAGIRNVITNTNEHGVLITGTDHLYGLVDGGGTCFDPEKFFIVPINLDKFFPEDYIKRPGPRVSFAINSKNVIHVTEEGWSDAMARKVIFKWNKVDYRN